MRYIDADKIPYTSYLGDDEPRVYKSQIDAIPAASVESVVYCDECKFWECEKCCVNAPFGCPEREKSDFCSRGKRKGDVPDA
jgi:hypothetical protein